MILSGSEVLQNIPKLNSNFQMSTEKLSGLNISLALVAHIISQFYLSKVNYRITLFQLLKQHTY